MRLLFASTAGAGHFRPLIPWIELAVARGHDVLVVGPGQLAELAVPRFPFRAGAAPDPGRSPDLSRLAGMTHDEAAPLMIGEVFARYNSGALLPTMRQCLEQWSPDIVLRDPTEFASACAASEAGVPQVRVGHGLAGGEESMLSHAASVLEELMSGTVASIEESRYLTMWPAELDPSRFRNTLRYRDAQRQGGGAGDAARTRATEPLVYVTFGTVGPRMPQLLPTYRHALAACAGLDARVLMTVGRDLDVTTLGAIPGNVRLEPWIDQGTVLSSAAAVLSHGGSGTVLGALEAGCPQVIFPLFADQTSNARAFAVAGLGVALLDTGPGGTPAHRTPSDADEGLMRIALEGVLSDPRYAAAATGVATSLKQLPTVDEIAEQVVAGL